MGGELRGWEVFGGVKGMGGFCGGMDVGLGQPWSGVGG